MSNQNFKIIHEESLLKPGKYQFMKDLAIEEFKALYESIKEKGIINPIIIDSDRNIIDGHHRYRAYLHLISEGIVKDLNIKVRDNLTEEEKESLAKELNIVGRALTAKQKVMSMSKEERYTLVKKLLVENPSKPFTWYANQSGVSDKTVKKIAEGKMNDLTNASKKGTKSKFEKALEVIAATEAEEIPGDKIDEAISILVAATKKIGASREAKATTEK